MIGMSDMVWVICLSHVSMTQACKATWDAKCPECTMDWQLILTGIKKLGEYLFGCWDIYAHKPRLSNIPGLGTEEIKVGSNRWLDCL